MQLNELSYLQTIAQQHSISAAAAKLNLSQQRLSRIVQNIENELGLKIFTRSKKGVILTKDGVQFTAHFAYVRKGILQFFRIPLFHRNFR